LRRLNPVGLGAKGSVGSVVYHLSAQNTDQNSPILVCRFARIKTGVFA